MIATVIATVIPKIRYQSECEKREILRSTSLDIVQVITKYTNGLGQNRIRTIPDAPSVGTAVVPGIFGS